MDEYIQITKALVSKMTLTDARLLTGRNLRSDIDPLKNKDGFFIMYDKGGFDWMTEPEFREADFYRNLKEEDLA